MDLLNKTDILQDPQIFEDFIRNLQRRQQQNILKGTEQQIIENFEGDQLILSVLNSFDIFQQRQKHLGPLSMIQQQILLENLSLKAYRKLDQIFKRGQKADCFYIVIKGEVAWLMSSQFQLENNYRSKSFSERLGRFVRENSNSVSPKQSKKFQKEDQRLEKEKSGFQTISNKDQFQQHLQRVYPQYDVIQEFSESEGFGQIIQKPIQREQGYAVCIEDCLILELGRVGYEKILSKFYQSFYESRIQFLRQFQIFDLNVPNTKLMILISSAMEQRLYSSKESVYQKGEEVEFVYFIKRGEIEILRDSSQITNFTLKTQNSVLSGSPSPRKSPTKLNQIYEICVLNQNQYFGDEEVAENFDFSSPEKRINSARVKSDSAVLFRIKVKNIFRCLQEAFNNQKMFYKIAKQKLEWEEQRFAQVLSQINQQQKEKQRAQQEIEKRLKVEKFLNKNINQSQIQSKATIQLNNNAQNYFQNNYENNSQTSIVNQISNLGSKNVSSHQSNQQTPKKRDNFQKEFQSDQTKKSVQETLSIARKNKLEINFTNDINKMLQFKDNYLLKSKIEEVNYDILKLLEINRDPFRHKEEKKQHTKKKHFSISRKISEPSLVTAQSNFNENNIQFQNNQQNPAYDLASNQITLESQNEQSPPPLINQQINFLEVLRNDKFFQPQRAFDEIEPLIQLRGLLAKKQSNQFGTNSENIYDQIQQIKNNTLNQKIQNQILNNPNSQTSFQNNSLQQNNQHLIRKQSSSVEIKRTPQLNQIKAQENGYQPLPNIYKQVQSGFKMSNVYEFQQENLPENNKNHKNKNSTEFQNRHIRSNSEYNIHTQKLKIFTKNKLAGKQWNHNKFSYNSINPREINSIQQSDNLLEKGLSIQRYQQLNFKII